jgi:sulfhydrogenase subunit beta (sulfur reductase)
VAVKTTFVTLSDLRERLRSLRNVHTFSPHPADGASWLDADDGADDPLAGLRRPRAAQSAKGLFMPACESAGCYGASACAATDNGAEPRAILGVRACELRSLAYLDKVMLGGAFADPSYKKRRDGTTIIATDCVDCAESCFCTLVGGEPWAEAGFDLNLTPLDDGFVVEIATDKGAALLGAEALTEASTDQLVARDRQREAMKRRVDAQNERYTFRANGARAAPLPEASDEAWAKVAADCVECGACTHVCPTCHCFYLFDQLLGPEQFERVRTWDSCLLSTYHRMAGTDNVKGTPRPGLPARLANRLLHKFVYSRQQYDMDGCVGCGRCTDACLGAIDIRDAVQELTP